jgi:hypothetical protein
MTDTERLDFLLTFLDIDDVGDDAVVPGVVANYEGLEESLTFGEQRNYVCECAQEANCFYRQVDKRRLIDLAIEEKRARDQRLMAVFERENKTGGCSNVDEGQCREGASE